jgi:putative copper export protein
LWLVIILGGVLLFVFLAVVALFFLSRLKSQRPAQPAKAKKKEPPKKNDDD